MRIGIHKHLSYLDAGDTILLICSATATAGAALWTTLRLLLICRVPNRHWRAHRHIALQLSNRHPLCVDAARPAALSSLIACRSDGDLTAKLEAKLLQVRPVGRVLLLVGVVNTAIVTNTAAANSHSTANAKA